MKELQMKYDALCYHIFSGLRNLSRDEDSLNLKNFDGEDEEHLCVLAIAAACSGILGKSQVSLDGSRRIRKRLVNKYKNCFTIVKNRGTGQQIDVPEFLDGLREYARELCGEWFYFGDIYDAYYNEKGER